MNTISCHKIPQEINLLSLFPQENMQKHLHLQKHLQQMQYGIEAIY